MVVGEHEAIATANDVSSAKIVVLSAINSTLARAKTPIPHRICAWPPSATWASKLIAPDFEHGFDAATHTLVWRQLLEPLGSDLQHRFQHCSPSHRGSESPEPPLRSRSVDVRAAGAAVQFSSGAPAGRHWELRISAGRTLVGFFETPVRPILRARKRLLPASTSGDIRKQKASQFLLALSDLRGLSGNRSSSPRYHKAATEANKPLPAALRRVMR